MPLNRGWAHQQTQRRFFIGLIWGLGFQIQCWLCFGNRLAGRFDWSSHAVLHHLLMRSGERGFSYIVRLHRGRRMHLKNLSLIFHEGCFWRRVLQDYRLGTRGTTGFGGDNWSLALCCHSHLRIARTNGLNDFSSNTILNRILCLTQGARQNWRYQRLRRLRLNPALQNPRKK